MRRIDALALLALLAAAAPPLTAGEVYSWKDARGVTHYSQTPPPAGTRFEVRGIRNDAPTATPPPVSTPTAAAAPAASTSDTSQCEVARANIAALQGDAPVQQLGADGTPRELDADGRRSQLELAQAAVRAYCR